MACADRDWRVRLISVANIRCQSGPYDSNNDFVQLISQMGAVLQMFQKDPENIRLGLGEFSLQLTLLGADCKQYGGESTGDHYEIYATDLVDVDSVLFDLRDKNDRSLLTFTTNAIISFVPNKHAVVRYSNVIYTTIIDRMNEVDPKSLTLSLSMAGFDSFSLGTPRLASRFLSEICFFSETFNAWLKALGRRQKELDTKELLDTLTFKSLRGSVPWAPALPRLDEEFWISSGADALGNYAYYDFQSESGHTICLSVAARMPVGKIPLRDAFNIDIFTASNGIDLEYSRHIISALKPFIIYHQIFPKVSPSLPDFSEHPSLSADSRRSWLFEGCWDLSERLKRLKFIADKIDDEDEDIESSHSNGDIIANLTEQFQFLFGALEHLQDSYNQISVRNNFDFSGFYEVCCIVHYSFKTSLDSRVSEGFESELLLIFENRNNKKIVVMTNCRDTGGGYDIDWLLTTKEDLEGRAHLFFDYGDSETIDRILKLCDRE